MNLMFDGTSSGSTRDGRRSNGGMIGVAQLMMILDATIINMALRSAQRALGLHHSGPATSRHCLHLGVRKPAAARRQARRPVRPPGHVPDRAGRFAGVLAIGGGSVRFAVLISARAWQRRIRRALDPVRAVAADHQIHRAEDPGQGVRHLRGSPRPVRLADSYNSNAARRLNRALPAIGLRSQRRIPVTRPPPRRASRRTQTATSRCLCGGDAVRQRLRTGHSRTVTNGGWSS